MNTSHIPTKLKVVPDENTMYEYKKIETELIRLTDLNKFGLEGWKFCWSFYNGENNTLLFCREKKH
ncbi:hypothetical protein [uncultured Methanobrevibacter sp.]|uniref:hypothetical protein n=1 Tax=uncultured Methanobrevibacter sp. TaxID=253161 RepID=UPI0025D209B3|nr:hypothetical protein [uncultured Methanobrevibacter sp.]MBR4591384.1 hypothetical protein [Bacteroidaceae bacterium]